MNRIVDINKSWLISYFAFHNTGSLIIFYVTFADRNIIKEKYSQYGILENFDIPIPPNVMGNIGLIGNNVIHTISITDNSYQCQFFSLYATSVCYYYILRSNTSNSTYRQVYNIRRTLVDS